MEYQYGVLTLKAQDHMAFPDQIAPPISKPGGGMHLGKIKNLVKTLRSSG